MDLGKLKPSDWLMVGGAAGFLIFGTFVGWIKLSGGGQSESDGNAFDFFLTGTIPWILIIGVGVIALLLAAGLLQPGATPWPLVLLLASGLGTLLVLLRLLFPTMGEETELLEELGVDIGRGIGLWLSTVSAAVSLAGAFMSFTASGGNLSDLTDMDKMKGVFGRSSPPPPPPPPPPAGAPPAPPPMAPPAPPAPPAGGPPPPPPGT